MAQPILLAVVTAGIVWIITRIKKVRRKKAALLSAGAGVLAALLLFAIPLLSREEGTFSELLLDPYPNVHFDRIVLRDYNHTPSQRRLDGAAYDALLSYLKDLPLQTAFPRQADYDGSALTLRILGTEDTQADGELAHTSYAVQMDIERRQLRVRILQENREIKTGAYTVLEDVDLALLYRLLDAGGIS